MFKVGSFGTGINQFDEPQGIAVHGSGVIFVADTENHRIQVFDPYGTYLDQWGTSGENDGQFFGPRGVAVDDDGNVYVHKASSVLDGNWIGPKKYGWELPSEYNLEIDTRAELWMAEGLLLNWSRERDRL